MATRVKKLITYVHYEKVSTGTRQVLLAEASYQYNVDGQPADDYTHPYRVIDEHKGWIQVRNETEFKRLLDFFQVFQDRDYHVNCGKRQLTAIIGHRDGCWCNTCYENGRKTGLRCRFKKAYEEYLVKRETGEPMEKSGYVYNQDSVADEAEASLLAMSFINNE